MQEQEMWAEAKRGFLHKIISLWSKETFPRTLPQETSLCFIGQSPWDEVIIDQLLGLPEIIVKDLN